MWESDQVIRLISLYCDAVSFGGHFVSVCEREREEEKTTDQLRRMVHTNTDD